jgi:SecD/SecF fusion protein
VTTFIVAAIMFYLGSGPIRGFAVTLAIGIITTVFTAFLVTRWMIAFWLRHQAEGTAAGHRQVHSRGHGLPLHVGAQVVLLAVGDRFGLLAVVLFFTMSMNLGIDFRGGSMMEVQAAAAQADVADVRTRLTDLDFGEVQVQEFGSPRELLIRIGAQGDEAAEQQVIQQVRTALEADYEFRRVEVVGPTISAELARAGTIAVIAHCWRCWSISGCASNGSSRWAPSSRRCTTWRG